MRTSIPFHLPVAGHDDILPVAEIGIFRLKTVGHGLRIREISELPYAVQRLIKRRLAAITQKRLFLAKIRDKNRSCLQTIDICQIAVFPVASHLYLLLLVLNILCVFINLSNIPGTVRLSSSFLRKIEDFPFSAIS